MQLEQVKRNIVECQRHQKERLCFSAVLNTWSHSVPPFTTVSPVCYLSCHNFVILVKLEHSGRFHSVLVLIVSGVAGNSVTTLWQTHWSWIHHPKHRTTHHSCHHTHHPQTSLKEHQTMCWSVHCHANCLCLISVRLATTSIESPQTTAPVIIPQESQEYLEVFSKTKASGLPPYHPYDFAIGLLVWATTLHNRL